MNGTSARAGLSVELINELGLYVPAGATLLEASLGAGLPHQHACGGTAQCSTCRVLVEEGGEHLSPPSDPEAELARRLRLPPEVRLACQARVLGNPVRVHRLIRDELDQRILITDPTAGGPRSLGEERELALLFLDIRNFTPFVESHLPFDVIHMLNRFFAFVERRIDEAGGRIVVHVGDGLFAVFGCQQALAEATASAFACGQRLLKELEALNEAYFERYFFHRLQIGLGLHVGQVICGNVGVGTQERFNVIGHHVNVAARVEAATKEIGNSFLVSETAFSQLTAPPERATRHEVMLKGVQAPLVVHAVGCPYQAGGSMP